MAKPLQQGRLTAEVFWETPGDNYPRTKSYGVSSLKGCFRSVKNATFHIVLFDEEGKPIGSDTTGDPSEALRHMIDHYMDGLSEEPEAASA